MVRSQEELAEIFQIPLDEQPLEDFGCAIAQDILIHGRLYITRNYALFHSKIFGFTTIEKIALRDISSIEKANTAKFIPNAIELYTHAGRKYVFTSFAFRDAAYRFLALLWRVANELPILPEGEDEQGVSKPSEERRGSTGDSAGEDAEQTVYHDPSTGSSSSNSNTTSNTTTPATATSAASAAAGNSSSTSTSSGATATNTPTNGASSTDQGKGKGKGKGKDSSNTVSSGGNSPNDTTANTTTPITLGPRPTGKRPDVHDKEHVTISQLSASVVEKMKEVVNDLLPVTVPEAYRLFFEDKTFAQEFHGRQGDSELEITDWVEHTDGSRTRNVEFRTKLDHKIGPKSTRVQEKQTLRHDPSEGHLILQTSTRTPDVPYGDSFTVETRYSITEAPDGQGAWMYVTIGVHFQKSIWIKGIIERGAVNGGKDYFKAWRQVAMNMIQRYRDGEVVLQQQNAPIKASTAPTPTQPVVVAPVHIEPVPAVDPEDNNPLSSFISLHTLLLILAIVAVFTIIILFPSWLFASGGTGGNGCSMGPWPTGQDTLTTLQQIAANGNGGAHMATQTRYWQAQLSQAQQQVSFAKEMLSLLQHQLQQQDPVGKDTEL